jgi:hypothetical protein
VYGIDAYLVEVEVDVGSARMQDFNVVGLPDNAVKESRERIKSALRNCGFEFPYGQGVTINLAPADVRKEGSGFDLPMALGLAGCMGQFFGKPLDQCMFLGELSLDGGVRPVRGALSAALAARDRQIETSLVHDLLKRIREASPDFFERLMVNLVLGMGYGGSAKNAGRTLGRTGDDGVDGVIDQDALGLDRVYIQAKRYAAGNNIGPGAIRDFFGSLDRHKASKGLFVTTSTFSASATEIVEHLSKRIVLIDGNQLARLMIRHNIGCRVEETLHIKKIDEEFFE